MPRMPTFFLSHGGGPWPWMTSGPFADMEVLRDSLSRFPEHLPAKPKAVLLVSAHWEGTGSVEVSAGQAPGMLYDYYGFPPETYSIKYPAPGCPDVAKRVQQLLRGSGIPCELNTKRGYDHGTFVPMGVMYPKADMPLVQMSILSSYDPKTHIAIGRALAPLRDEGIAIVGSGLSFHNLGLMGPVAKTPSAQFDKWLQSTLIPLVGKERTEAVCQWEKAPSARVCHPQEDHLVPLFVAVGAAENDTATCIYHEKNNFGGLTCSSFRFA